MQFRIAATVTAMFLAGAAAAQETDAQETDAQETGQADQSEGFSTGTEVSEDGSQIGQPYVEETFGAWQKRCVRTEDGNDPCQMYQLMTDVNGGSVAEITVFPLEGSDQVVAGATVITPLETLLTENVTIRVDGGAAKRYPFTFCTTQGCVSRIGLTAEDLASFRAGASAQIRIVPAAAPDQQVVVDASLSGFTAAFNALSEE